MFSVLKREEYLLMLKQACGEYRFYQFQISACEEKKKELQLKQAPQIVDGDKTDFHLEKKKDKEESI